MRKKRGSLWGKIVLLVLLLFIVSTNVVAILRYLKAKEELAAAKAEYESLLKRVEILEKDVNTLESILETTDGED